jgi:hypothetical protein
MEEDHVEWMIIDGIGPFFRGYEKKRINWSKIPFEHVQSSGMLHGKKRDRLYSDFEAFMQQAVDAGYNTVTLDDLAHLIHWDGYHASTHELLADYEPVYRRLFQIAGEHCVRVLVTSDVMFFCQELEQMGNNHQALIGWLRERLQTFFVSFPEVSGVVFRIGESDAIGTKGEFSSRLLLKTPGQANRFIRELLPVFEENGRYFVFRTWTVGAHAIGDLIWHRRTFRKTFRGISSKYFIVSMKYGESDFFRYLPLNRHFFRTRHQTIVEFQARREYEGFGEYPSFVGWEYARYVKELAGCPYLVGASVWAQTGGWGKFHRLTYIENSSVWVELNVFVTAALCRGASVPDAVRDYCQKHFPKADPDGLLAFLALSDDVIRELLYVRQFAEQKLFFRRLRVPPLLFCYWDRFFVGPAVRRALRLMVDNHVLCVAEGYTALGKLDIMRSLAKTHNLPTLGLDFQRDTFEILAVLREYIFGDYNQEIIDRLTELKKAYRKKWKPRYSLKFDFSAQPRSYIRWKWVKQFLLREKRGYRLLDSVVTLRLLSYIYPLTAPFRRRLLPKFAQKQAMGIDAVFK